jgi:hypothetical protein
MLTEGVVLNIRVPLRFGTHCKVERNEHEIITFILCMWEATTKLDLRLRCSDAPALRTGTGLATYRPGWTSALILSATVNLNLAVLEC